MSKAIDPVCGMEVEIGGEHFTTYQGVNYYFCCPSCLNKFAKDPDKHINHDAAVSMKSSNHSHCGNHQKTQQHDGCCGKHHHHH